MFINNIVFIINDNMYQVVHSKNVLLVYFKVSSFYHYFSISITYWRDKLKNNFSLNIFSFTAIHKWIAQI